MNNYPNKRRTQASGKWAAANLTLALSLTVALTNPALAETEIEIPLSRPGEPIIFEAEMLQGSLEVIGEDRDNVRLLIDNVDSKHGRRIVTPSGSKVIPMSSYAVDVEEEDNHVKVDADWKASGVKLRALVPYRADVKLSSIRGGGILVDGIQGRLELSHVHGSIEARNINGTAVAETVHGSISVELDQAEADKPMAFTTVHGNVDVSLPMNFATDVNIDSRQNEIYSDFEVEFKQRDPVISRNRHNKHNRIKLENTLWLEINGGGTPVRIETLHGEVSLRKSER